MGPFFSLGSSLLGNSLKLLGWWFFLSLFPFYLLNSCDPDVTTSRTVSLIFSSFLSCFQSVFLLCPQRFLQLHISPHLSVFFISPIMFLRVPFVSEQSFCILIVSCLFYASLVAQTVKNLPAVQETRFSPWVGKIPWRRKWLPAPVFLPGEFHGQRSLVGYSSWDRSQTWLSNKHFDLFFLKFHAGSVFSISDNIKFSPLYIDFLLYTVFLFSFFGHHLSY